MCPTQELTLSICIATFNRATTIGESLESIFQQEDRGFEVVVIDGASTDATEEVVRGYAERYKRIRYIKQDKNNGVDRDYDAAVMFSSGKYCWFMSDDDTLKPGAIAAVMSRLEDDVSVVVVNVEARSNDMTRVVQERFFDISEDRSYEPGDMHLLFTDIGTPLNFIGCIVILRSLWIARDREQYYGSMYMHVGVVFQEHPPGRMLVLAAPLINYRTGSSHTFSTRLFELGMFSWPTVVWSLCLPKSAKKQICSERPWREVGALLRWRAIGLYSFAEFERLIHPKLRIEGWTPVPWLVASVPGVLANFLLVLYYSLCGKDRNLWLQWLKASKFYFLGGCDTGRGGA